MILEEAQKSYDNIYNEVYTNLSASVRPISHSLAKIEQLRKGSMEVKEDMQSKDASCKKNTITSPSVLAADWANMGNEMK